ncbi:major facilitator superfamily domain-containing protein [Colletotrichum phormii]|uniref:Major facilitator superfamily domain-containing protein n=1 Tax=Colletotrichum phormii TaxID=359342 RepID=A0AAJ0EAS9_9PEZI|nr:major facilitator superfamily domain-containing protein [Colletotrichum phormii]KAK1624901.1 major facilitator superfamily domain-containing protein [Colletotrichum phormii]
MSFNNRISNDAFPHSEPSSEVSTATQQKETTVVNESEGVEIESRPQDGGRLAWLQVAGSFFLFFNTWGILSSNGVFQAYYQENMKHVPADSIAWIGSIQSSLLLFTGVLVGPLYDADYFRSLTFTGITLIFLGMTMTSIATAYWQVLLAQAFCVGLGSGCIYIPSVSIIPQYFSERRALATGIVATGSSLGGVVYSLIFQSLYPRVGFPWATRVLAFISLATNAFAFSVLRQRRRVDSESDDEGAGKRKRRVMLDLSAYRNVSFVVFSAAMFFNFFSYMAPIYYLQQYSLAHGLSSPGSSKLAYYLVAILNAGSILGRVFPAWLAGHFGPINVLLNTVSVSIAAVALSWLAVHDAAGSVAFALAYGFASGRLVSLPPTVISSLVPDLSLHGTWLGMLCTTNAFGSLAGPPIAGVLLQATGGYLGVQLLSGLGMVAMTILMLALRVTLVGKQQSWKV